MKVERLRKTKRRPLLILIKEDYRPEMNGGGWVRVETCEVGRVKLKIRSWTMLERVLGSTIE